MQADAGVQANEIRASEATERLVVDAKQVAATVFGHTINAEVGVMGHKVGAVQADAGVQANEIRASEATQRLVVDAAQVGSTVYGHAIQGETATQGNLVTASSVDAQNFANAIKLGEAQGGLSIQAADVGMKGKQILVSAREAMTRYKSSSQNAAAQMHGNVLATVVGLAKLIVEAQQNSTSVASAVGQGASSGYGNTVELFGKRVSNSEAALNAVIQTARANIESVRVNWERDKAAADATLEQYARQLEAAKIPYEGEVQGALVQLQEIIKGEVAGVNAYAQMVEVFGRIAAAANASITSGGFTTAQE